MKATRITVAALVVLALLVGAGTAAAAAPGNGNGNAPDDAGSDHAGPPTDVPGPVPDFVEEIHRTVGEFLDGSIDALGSAVSDLTPDGEGPAESGSTDAGA